MKNIFGTMSAAFVSLAVAAIALVHPLTSLAGDPPVGSPASKQIQPDTGKERNFYDVIEDLLADFEYDLKNGDVKGLKDLSIRNIATSENIPASFKSHLELLVTERILKQSKTKALQCLPCKGRRANLSGDRVTISASDNNPEEMFRIAKTAGIAHFMDIAFAYQRTGILLSMHITDPETSSVIWSRTYNSENSRAASNRRGVDYSQIDEARTQTEYTPSIQYRPIIYYVSEPNVGRQTGCLGFGFRMVERYDNRKKEVGFEANYLLVSSSLIGGAGTETNLYTGFNGTLLFTHAWNLIGDEENFNRPRGSIMLGIGGTYASGFLGGLVRASYEWRLGKHYAFSGILGYRPTSTPFIAGSAATPVSGVEFGVGFNFLF